MILSVDKGSASVVMENLEYSEILASRFEDGSESKIKKDLTLQLNRKLSHSLNKNKACIALNTYRLLSQF